MDIVLEIADFLLFDYFYSTLLPATPTRPTYKHALRAATQSFSSFREAPTPYRTASRYLSLGPTQFINSSSWPRDNPCRQAFSLFLIAWLFGTVVYFVFATLSYLFVFDHATLSHPKYLRNQMRLEIRQTLIALPCMALLTTPFFLAEVQGYSKLYDGQSDAPFRLYNLIQFPFFIGFTDLCIYWIHRGLHHPLIYKTLHKPHHKWIMPTPFASHAFHPLDGWAQSVPYHAFPFLFPLHKVAYIILFIGINIWTILIHDGEYVSNHPVINGAACHTMHHLYFNYNYGQFTTLWDRMGGSYRAPNAELFNRESKMSRTEWQNQCKEMERAQKEVEGDDDRKYRLETVSTHKKLA